MPLYKVTLPVQTMALFRKLQQVVSFEFLEIIYPDFSRDLGITETPPYNDRFDRLGYQERNIVANMGSIVIFACFVFLKVIFAILFTCLGCKFVNRNRQ